MRAVLAGGKSKRFGKDKLLAIVDGKTSIEMVVENVKPHVLITTSVERCRLYWKGPCIIDEGRGPAEAVLELSGEALIVPGDMPWLKLDTLEMLASFADVLKADVAAPLFKESIEFSVIYLKDVNKLKWLKRRKNRPLRMTDFLRAGGRVVLVGSRLLTRDPVEWAHLNTRTSLLTRTAKGEPCDRIIVYEARFDPFSPSYEELRLYRKLGLKILEEHVLKDLSLHQAPGL